MDPQYILRPKRTELLITQRAPALEFLRAIDKQGLQDRYSDGGYRIEQNRNISPVYSGKTQCGHIKLKKLEGGNVWVFADWPIKIYAKDSEYWEKKQNGNAELDQGEHVKVGCYLERHMSEQMWHALMAIKYAKTKEKNLIWVPEYSPKVREEPSNIWFKPSTDVQEILSDAEKVSRLIILIGTSLMSPEEKNQAATVFRKLNEVYTLMRAFSAFEEELSSTDPDAVLRKPPIPKEFTPTIKSVRKSWERLKAQLCKLIDSLDQQTLETLQNINLI